MRCVRIMRVASCRLFKLLRSELRHRLLLRGLCVDVLIEKIPEVSSLRLDRLGLVLVWHRVTWLLTMLLWSRLLRVGTFLAPLLTLNLALGRDLLMGDRLLLYLRLGGSLTTPLSHLFLLLRQWLLHGLLLCLWLWHRSFCSER